MYVRIYVCMCVCIRIFVCIYTYLYIYIYIGASVYTTYTCVSSSTLWDILQTFPKVPRALQRTCDLDLAKNVFKSPGPQSFGEAHRAQYEGVVSDPYHITNPELPKELH